MCLYVSYYGYAQPAKRYGTRSTEMIPISFYVNTLFIYVRKEMKAFEFIDKAGYLNQTY